MLMNRRLMTGVIGMLFLTATSIVAADKKQDEKWAVLIGVDEYSYAKPLQFCGADMRSLKAELLRAGFDERQVVLLDDEAKEKRLQPYRSNIETQIELVCANAEKGDFVLVAFSGHGLLLDKTSYLCSTDSKPDDAKSLISLDWVYQQLQRSQADLRLVLVDACRNVPAELSAKRSITAAELKDSTRAFVKDAERLPEGVLLLNSCSEGEFAQESKEFGHGVFMHFLLEGLRGKADQDGDKSVTLNELFRFTSKETKLHVSTRFADSQRPKLKGNLTVEVLDYQVASIGAPQPMASKSSTKVSAPDSQATDEKTITSRSTGMKLTLIPAGTFKMGSPPNETGHKKNEGPTHATEISRPFYMAIYEVTQGEYKTIMGANPSSFASLSGHDTARFPVESLSWYDAIEFCNKLSEKDGLTACYKITNAKRKGGHIESADVAVTKGSGYRLPTEAEWEYACRSNTSTPFNVGDVLNVDDANISVDSPDGASSMGAGLDRPTTVGSYKPNRFGLYDMHGNVCEWCFDTYDERAYEAKSKSTKDPVVTSGSEFRVLRGGSFRYVSNGARSSRRSTQHLANTSYADDFGFRIVRN